MVYDEYTDTLRYLLDMFEERLVVVSRHANQEEPYTQSANSAFCQFVEALRKALSEFDTTRHDDTIGFEPSAIRAALFTATVWALRSLQEDLGTWITHLCETGSFEVLSQTRPPEEMPSSVQRPGKTDADIAQMFEANRAELEATWKRLQQVLDLREHLWSFFAT